MYRSIIQLKWNEFDWQPAAVGRLLGEPVPEVTWFKNKKKLKKSKRTKMWTQAETGVCTLEISDATAEDSGQYTVQLDNEVRLVTLPYLTLPYLRGGQALTPAQRWGRISSAQCTSPNVTARLQVAAIKP